MSAAQTRPSSFLAPRGRACGQLVEKGSRFVCEILPLAGEDDVGSFLEEFVERFSDATHHCWAYRVGSPPRERSSDDGEPAGTAGAPMLKTLSGRDLTNVLAVVARWFGGVKLGRGGLARAYAGAVAAAVAAADLERHEPTEDLVLEVTYARLDRVKHLLRRHGAEIVAAGYGARVRLGLRVPSRARGELESELAGLGVLVQATR